MPRHRTLPLASPRLTLPRPDPSAAFPSPSLQEMGRKSSDEEAFSGLAFKIMTDPFVGSLTFVRVYSGVLEVRWDAALPAVVVVMLCWWWQCCC